MSTRSRIAITKAGGFRSVYCHNSGYPQGPWGVGFTLLTHYAEREKVEQLMIAGAPVRTRAGDRSQAQRDQTNE